MRRLLILTLLMHACDRGATSVPEPAPTGTPDAVTGHADAASPTAEDAAATTPSPSERGDTAVAETEADPDPVPEPAADPYEPLPDEITARFAAIAADPEPSELTRNSHYWISNERSQFLWYEAIAGVGDAYVGVGTDQNYMLAGWAKSDLLILMDFDQAIVNLHRVYAALFAAADTPEEFHALWTEDRHDEVQALLETTYADHPERTGIVRAHTIARKLVYARLKRLVRQYPTLGIPTFVTDQSQYDHVRTLWANGRVIPIRGDLTAASALRGIGDALKASDMELGVLYLSNAEQYFDYLPQFRRNIVNLPFSERSVVLRTLGWEFHGFVEGEEYHYNRQPGRNFARWMETNRVKRSGRILRKKSATDTDGNSVLDREPEASDPPPEIAP